MLREFKSCERACECSVACQSWHPLAQGQGRALRGLMVREFKC